MGTGEPNFFLLAFNVLLTIAAAFGGIVLRGIITDVRSLQSANLALIERMGSLAPRTEVKADISEVRSETREALADLARAQKDGFEKVFDRLDDIRQQVANKADR